MTPGLWGLLTALGWGSADFIARFTGRALGVETALLAMLAVGALALPVAMWVAGVGVPLDAAGIGPLLATGAGVLVATLLLYQGLARGPVTVVAPIVGSYPALNVALAVLLGARPSALGWAAMGAVLAGVITVGASARSFEDSAALTRSQLRRTIGIALASALGFAVTVAAAQEAGRYYGELQTVCLARWVSLALMALVFVARRTVPRVPGRWWPLLGAQGLLDAGAYVALLAGSEGPGSAIAVVVASSFSAVTVALARIVLREPMTWPQWGGIAAIVGGVAVLSA